VCLDSSRISTAKIYKRIRDKGKPAERAIFEIADYTTGIRRPRGFGRQDDAQKKAEKIARQLSTSEAIAAIHSLGIKTTLCPRRWPGIA